MVSMNGYLQEIRVRGTKKACLAFLSLDEISSPYNDVIVEQDEEDRYIARLSAMACEESLIPLCKEYAKPLDLDIQGNEISEEMLDEEEMDFFDEEGSFEADTVGIYFHFRGAQEIADECPADLYIDVSD